MTGTVDSPRQRVRRQKDRSVKSSNYEGWISGVELLEKAQEKANQDYAEQAGREYHEALCKCVEELQSVEECKNVERFVALCIKYADRSQDPVGAFRRLAIKGVGRRRALFWGAWAWAAEARGAWSEAARALAMGEQCHAEPALLLYEFRSSFEERLKIQIKKSDNLSQPQQQHNSNSSAALSCTNDEKAKQQLFSGNNNRSIISNKHNQQQQSTDNDDDDHGRRISKSLKRPRSSPKEKGNNRCPESFVVFQDDPVIPTGSSRASSSPSTKSKKKDMELQQKQKRQPLQVINENQLNSFQARAQQKTNEILLSTVLAKRIAASISSKLSSNSSLTLGFPVISSSLFKDLESSIIPGQKSGRPSFSPLVIDPFEKRHRAIMTVKSKDLEDFLNKSKLVVDLRGDEEKNIPGEKLNWPKKATVARRYDTYKLGKHRIAIHSELGNGAYGTVFCCKMLSHRTKGGEFAVKVERPPQVLTWECYMLQQVATKHASKDCEHNDLVVVSAKGLYLYQNASALVCGAGRQGTLHDLVGRYHARGERLPELVAMHYAVEMTRWLELIISCNILHCDIKTDNWLITRKKKCEHEDGRQIYESMSLIDFGKAIDLKMYSEAVQFEGRCTAKSFECIEMRESRPWKYQVDAFGLACCVHFLLFGSYLEPVAVALGGGGQRGEEARAAPPPPPRGAAAAAAAASPGGGGGDGGGATTTGEKEEGAGLRGGTVYRPRQPFRRYWQKDLWQEFFDTLLNKVETHEPPLVVLKRIRCRFQEYLYENKANFESLKLHLTRESQYTLKQPSISR